MNTARELRTRIAQEEILTGVGARDALEAKLIEKAGFDFVWSSGFCISASYSVADASLISMTQLLDRARSMAEVTGIPVVADCDTGFGNANNVIYAVKRFEEAGAAAICIEDKRFPKDTSLLPGGRQELTSIEEFTGKVKAAADTRNGDLVLVARTEALIAGWGHKEALNRAHHYVEAGADCILIHSKSRTPNELIEFAQRWDGSAPLVIVPTTYPSFTEDQVRRIGKIKMVIYANQPLRASVLATEQLLTEIKSAGGIHTITDKMVPVSRIFELQDVRQMKENEKKYLP